jgi:hypothetical protein
MPSYELDMPAPEGLSGSPLLSGDDMVIGVVYGNNEVATIDQFSSIDPTTGERQPEIQRVVSFALAYHTDALSNLTGKATHGVALKEYLKDPEGSWKP